VDPLELAGQELDRLCSRLRSIGSGRLASAAEPPFGTRASAIRHLVRELVAVADDTLPYGYPAPVEDLMLGDQLAVVGAEALAALGRRGDDPVFVLGELVLHRYDLDGTLPGGDVAAALGDGALVADLRARCPASAQNG
jgi:hypothetical protein